MTSLEICTVLVLRCKQAVASATMHSTHITMETATVVHMLQERLGPELVKAATGPQQASQITIVGQPLSQR